MQPYDWLNKPYTLAFCLSVSLLLKLEIKSRTAHILNAGSFWELLILVLTQFKFAFET